MCRGRCTRAAGRRCAPRGASATATTTAATTCGECRAQAECQRTADKLILHEYSRYLSVRLGQENTERVANAATHNLQHGWRFIASIVIFIVIQKTIGSKPFLNHINSDILPPMKDAPKNPPAARGRPGKRPEERLIQRSIRLTPAQWAKVDEYGLGWLRQLIQKAKPPRDPSASDD